MKSSSSSAAGITFVPFSMEKSKPIAQADNSIQFVDDSSKYHREIPPPHANPTPIRHVSSPLIHNSSTKQYISNNKVSPLMMHVSTSMSKQNRRASVCSLSASVTSNSSSSDKSTDSSNSSKSAKQTLESQTFQFKVHDKEQPKLVFFNLVTKEQIEKKRKYVRKKPVSASVQIIEKEEFLSPSLCGKRNSEHVNYQSNPSNNTELSPSANSTSTTHCNLPRISFDSLNLSPPQSFIPSKRRTSISIAELLN